MEDCKSEMVKMEVEECCVEAVKEGWIDVKWIVGARWTPNLVWAVRWKELVELDGVNGVSASVVGVGFERRKQVAFVRTWASGSRCRRRRSGPSACS